jgi:hypothetical protein
VPEAVRVAGPRGIGCCSEQARCAEETFRSNRSRERYLPSDFGARLNPLDHTIVISVPTSTTNKSTGSVFPARRTEAVCCGVSNKNSGRSERDRLRFAYVKDQGLAMKRLLPLTSVTTTSVAFAALRAGGGVANADGFSQTNLVSDMPGLATITDSSLVNPGVSRLRTGSPIRISNQSANMAPLYPVTGSTGVAAAPFTVNIPTTASGPRVRPGRSPTHRCCKRQKSQLTATPVL